VSPFDDSRAPSRAGSDDDQGINTQTVSERFNIQPSAGLLLFPEDVEKDDYLHNPDPDDKEGGCNIFTQRGLVNIGGLALITLGVLILFIGYPILYVSFSNSGLVAPLLTTTAQNICSITRCRTVKKRVCGRSNVYRRWKCAAIEEYSNRSGRP
jgi:hypothetical protein